MEQYIINLFQNMSILTIALLGAGLLLCITEVFLPKIGLAGLLGIVLVFLGFSSYYIDGHSAKHIIGMLTIITVIIALFVMIELILEGKGVIKNPDRYKFRTYNNPNSGLKDLVGLSGTAITNIDLGGTIEINGQLYYAISSNSITKGNFVEVVGVQNNTLIVR